MSDLLPKNANVRDTLFGDQPITSWASVANNEEPWKSFKTAKLHIDNDETAQAIGALKGVLETPGLESRHYLEAFQFLRDFSVPVPLEKQKHVLGVVIEVGTQVWYGRDQRRCWILRSTHCSVPHSRLQSPSSRGMVPGLRLQIRDS